MRFHAKPDALYLGDNGRCYCGEHLGACASASGHDLSGQAIMEVTPDMLDLPGADLIVCEQPRCGKRPSRLWAA